MRLLFPLILILACNTAKQPASNWIASRTSDSTYVDRLYIDSQVAIENIYVHGKFREGVLFDRYNKTSVQIADTNLIQTRGLGGFIDSKEDSVLLYFWIPMTRHSHHYRIYYIPDNVATDSFFTKDNPIWVTRHSIKDMTDIPEGKKLKGYYHVYDLNNHIYFKDTVILPRNHFSDH